jgi:hypothetical protein
MAIKLADSVGKNKRHETRSCNLVVPFDWFPVLVDVTAETNRVCDEMIPRISKTSSA